MSQGQNKLNDKVAIVTGAAHGIGAAIAERLLKEGASLMLADVLEPELKQTCNRLQGQYRDSNIEIYCGDLSEEDNFKQLVSKTIDRWGQIDILVNNAGGGVLLPFLDHNAETFKKTIDRNLWTVLWGCHTVLPHMIERNYGRIINMGADSVRNGLWDHAGYNAAKGGVHALTTGLAREFAKYNITFNTVAPCGVATPVLKEIQKTDPKLAERYLSVIPKGRPAEPEEVADAVNFLATDDATFITGQVISVNGGSTML